MTSGSEHHSASHGAPDRSAERPPRSRLVLRAIAWRLGSSVAFFVVAVAAITAAAAGPFYLTAADQTIVSSAIEAAPPTQTGISITDSPGAGQPAGPHVLLNDAATVPGGLGSSPTARYEPPIVTTDLASSFLSPLSGRPDGIELVYRTRACSETPIEQGHCPTAANQIAISTRTATQLRAHVGSVLLPGGKGGTARLPGGGELRLVVSGIYKPGDPSAPIWWGTNYFLFGGPSSGGSEALDAGWVTEAGAVNLSNSLKPTSWLELPLRPSTINAGNANSAVPSLASWEASVQTGGSVIVNTNLGSIITSVQSEEGPARTVVLVISLMLALLALLVLYNVARATSALRADDVRVAELRGLPRRNVAFLALREPVLLLLAAVPAGLALGWVVVALINSALLGITRPSFDALAIVAALATFVAGALAAALGSRALLRWKVSEESYEVANARRSRNAAVIDAFGIALAAAGAASLIASSNRNVGGGDPLALLGPGLLALGAGIIGARLLPLGARAVAAASRWTRHVVMSLASLSVSRRDGVARRVIVPTIAAGLLVFSIAGLVVQRRNNSMQSEFQVGAPVVLQATVAPGVNFIKAVRTADPSGREAMAAVSVQASYGQTLAVDSTRFAAVASWPHNISSTSAAAIARALKPHTAPPVTIPPGTRIDLTATLDTDIHPTPDLQLTFYDNLYPSELPVDFGFLKLGTHQYSAVLPGCPAGCRLDYFSLLWNGGKRVNPLAGNVQMDLLSLSVVNGHTTRTVPTAFAQAGAWTGSAGAVTSPTSSGTGLHVDTDFAGATSPPEVAPADLPPVVPAVVTSNFASLNANPATPSRYSAVGIDENQISVQSVAVVPALPRVGPSATMIDLSFAQIAQSAAPAGASFEVWCAKPPSAALMAALRHRGVTIVGINESSTVLKAFQHSGASLGFDLLGVAAAGALLLALGALLFATASGARSRGVELTGMAAVGVSRSALRRSLMAESLMVSVVGAVLGCTAGAVGAWLALTSLPEFPPGRVGPPLDLSLPWPAIIACGLAVLIVMAVAAVVSAGLVMRQVRPESLRLSA